MYKYIYIYIFIQILVDIFVLHAHLCEHICEHICEYTFTLNLTKTKTWRCHANISRMCSTGALYDHTDDDLCAYPEDVLCDPPYLYIWA